MTHDPLQAALPTTAVPHTTGPATAGPSGPPLSHTQVEQRATSPNPLHAMGESWEIKVIGAIRWHVFHLFRTRGVGMASRTRPRRGRRVGGGATGESDRFRDVWDYERDEGNVLPGRLAGSCTIGAFSPERR